MTTIADEHFETADELLDALSRRNPRWPGAYQAWIFRGQAEPWPLLPTALRFGATFPPHHPTPFAEPSHPSMHFMARVSAELDVLSEFLASLDMGGLQVPGDTPEIRGYFDMRGAAEGCTGASIITRAVRGELQWPPPALLPLVALAQHYGLPTRLLDWTYSPRVAAYFAAKEAAKRVVAKDTSPDKKVVIWATDTRELFALSSRQEKAAASHSVDGITLVHAPSHSNPNLTSQRGVFTLDRRVATHADNTCGTQPLDEAVQELAQSAPSYPETAMRKLTMPWTQARKLLRLLAQEGVTAAQIFPGHDGAAESCREQLLWDRVYRMAYRAID